MLVSISHPPLNLPWGCREKLFFEQNALGSTFSSLNLSQNSISLNPAAVFFCPFVTALLNLLLIVTPYSPFISYLCCAILKFFTRWYAQCQRCFAFSFLKYATLSSCESPDSAPNAVSSPSGIGLFFFFLRRLLCYSNQIHQL